jgi:hypothetical protein
MPQIKDAQILQKYRKDLKNSRCQNGDMKQVPH